jgi:hypothetical protein
MLNHKIAKPVDRRTPAETSAKRIKAIRRMNTVILVRQLGANGDSADLGKALNSS